MLYINKMKTLKKFVPTVALMLIISSIFFSFNDAYSKMWRINPDGSKTLIYDGEWLDGSGPRDTLAAARAREAAKANHKHSYTSKVTLEPTCTEDGIRVYTCSGDESYSCGNSYTEPIPATGHQYAMSDVVVATCTEDGTTTFTCKVCGDSYVEVFPAFGHNYRPTVTDPTCTEDGFTTYVCRNCKDEYVDDIVPAFGHTEQRNITLEPTYFKKGAYEIRCVTCNEVLETGEVQAIIPAWYLAQALWVQIAVFAAPLVVVIGIIVLIIVAKKKKKN